MSLPCRRVRIFRARGWGAFIVIACLAVVGAAQDKKIQVVYKSPSKEKSRVREGARLTDREGVFSERGGRYSFQIDGESDSFTLLENQTLERVASASSNQDSDQKWTVTGIVTEFNGGKYVLLERAVLKPRKNASGRNE
jgi:hypothetical protein